MNIEALQKIRVKDATRMNGPQYKIQESTVVHADCLIGIEIEVEGMMRSYSDFMNSTCASYWNIVGDGSLRDRGVEFVLKRPYSPAGISTAMKGFEKFIQDLPEKPRTPQTTSVHIHLDVSEMSVYDYLKFICLYYLFEDALVRSCGEYRYQNLYCLTNQQAPGVFDALRSVARDPRNIVNMDMDSFKYGALNLAATPNYNSLEFRAMGGTLNKEEIIDWINTLASIKLYAQSCGDINDILRDVSLDREQLIYRIFGDNADRVVDNFDEDVFWETCVDVQYVLNDLE